jgi:ribosomal protein S18 acetylase RimI-like enzyme
MGSVARTMAATSDSFVRAGRGSDAPALAELQLTCWQEAYGQVLPTEALGGLGAERDGMVERWRSSAEDPPGPRYHVLVAVGSAGLVVGSVALGPAEDADDLNPAVVGELLALQVAPPYRRVGHGTRLLAAAIDHLRVDGFVGAVTWLDFADSATAALLSSSGWAPDGTTRVLDLDGDGTVVVHQSRWHTDITDTTDAAPADGDPTHEED